MSRRAEPNVPRPRELDGRIGAAGWMSSSSSPAGKRTRARVDPEEYQMLHSRITAACRELAGSGDEAGRKFYEDHGGGGPTLAVRARTLPRRRRDPHSSARSVPEASNASSGAEPGYARSEMRGPGPFCSSRPRPSSVVTCWAAPWSPGPARGRRPGRFEHNQACALAVERPGEVVRLGVVVILISIYNVSRTARS